MLNSNLNCFAILNEDAPILENKQTPLGVQMHSKLDDVVDALVLAVIGSMALKSGFATLPKEPQKDNTGIYLQIVGAKL